MEVLIGMVCVIGIMIGAYHIIKGLSYLYYANHYLHGHLDEIKQYFIQMDLLNGKPEQYYEDEQVVESIKKARNKGIVYFIGGIIFILLFMIPLFY